MIFLNEVKLAPEIAPKYFQTVTTNFLKKIILPIFLLTDWVPDWLTDYLTDAFRQA